VDKHAAAAAAAAAAAGVIVRARCVCSLVHLITQYLNESVLAGIKPASVRRSVSSLMYCVII
jgi:hypothetical protein